MVRGLRTVDYRGAESVCEVHGTPLKEDVVPIVYGYIELSSDECEARRRRFPNAGVVWLGGCSARDSAAQQAKVLYCPDCRKQHRIWHQRHAH